MDRHPFSPRVWGGALTRGRTVVTICASFPRPRYRGVGRGFMENRKERGCPQLHRPWSDPRPDPEKHAHPIKNRLKTGEGGGPEKGGLGAVELWIAPVGKIDQAAW